jgi:hypothetical protein
MGIYVSLNGRFEHKNAARLINIDISRRKVFTKWL